MIAPLEGIRVVELASYVAAPAAGALLADLGAEVVKIEIPEGEIYRYATPSVQGVPDSKFPVAPQFQMDNRGKRSLALDVTKPAAQKAVRKLVDRADIFVTNMLPQRLEKYGLGPASLRAQHPKLICALLTGYGLSGEDANMPAFDYTAFWARTGLMEHMHEPDSPPAFLRPGLGDRSAALSLVAGVLAALRVRDATGEGQIVDVSLLHIGYFIFGHDTSLALAAGKAPKSHDRRRPTSALWNQYRTKDDRWIFLVMIDATRYWAPFCRALGREDLIEDARFKDFLSRWENTEELTAIVAGEIESRSMAEWLPIFEEHALISAPARTLDESIHDQQARATGVFQPMDHPSAGTFDTIAPPLRLSSHPMQRSRPGPKLGEHSREVLQEAGLSHAEIAALLET
jgi:crotonobetainyl-CoA:carnitine CoA-transferase CaiB-like acyl-CoA transferase